MKHFGLIALLIMAGAACAQEELTFQPPQPHDVQRYEAGWNKNPFTLKTAPPVVESVSFARDLATATYYGDSADPTIIVVNTKTNERIRLKQDQPAANGMILSGVKLGTSRKDVVAEVTLGTETASVRYNDSYVKQMAAAEMTQAPAIQQQLQQQQQQQQNRQQLGPQQKVLMPQTPVLPSKGAPPGSAPSTAQAASPYPGQPGFVPPAGTRNAVAQLSATSPASPVGAPSGSAPLALQTTSVNTSAPVPVRRRLIAPALNAGAISQ